jgi:hypothetical protein
MRTAFKVATVFTGAAACAAAFTPAAQAATATTAKTQQIKPDTVKKDCVIGPSTTSMVFYWYSFSNHGPTCVGSAGNPTNTVTLDHSFAGFCTGNNSGWFTSFNGTKIDFKRSQPSWTSGYVGEVHITGHGGAFRCPT